MSLKDSLGWEMIDTNKIFVCLGDLKNTILKTQKTLDKQQETMGEITKKMENIEKTQNLIMNTMIEHNQEYCKNKEVYLEILNKLNDDNNIVKPMLNNLEENNKKLQESLADPILLANRIYNRYWRAPYFKNNINLKNNLNNNLLPICSELLENQDL